MTTFTGFKFTAESPVLPVPLEDARLQLRLDDLAHDDAYVESLVYAQCSWVEQQFGVALLTKTVEEYHTSFPKKATDALWLRVSPVQSVTSVKYVGSDGAEQTWGANEYASAIVGKRTMIVPLPAYGWPTGLSVRPDAVKVTYSAGFGSAPANVPHYVRLGILARVGRAYTNREDPVTNSAGYSDQLLSPLWNYSV
jgi:uncharacterized phiE125 gp8 family phage protein